jgi:hypothetical protein
MYSAPHGSMTTMISLYTKCEFWNNKEIAKKSQGSMYVVEHFWAYSIDQNVHFARMLGCKNATQIAWPHLI